MQCVEKNRKRNTSLFCNLSHATQIESLEHDKDTLTAIAIQFAELADIRAKPRWPSRRKWLNKSYWSVFYYMRDGASSVYHFSGRLHLPYTDPLPSPFNASISSFRHIHYLQLLQL